MKPMKVDSAPNTDKYPCDGEGNRMQDIFVPVPSPLASDRPFPIDVEPVPTFAQSVDTVLAQVREVLLRKNAAYGNSALAPIRVFSKASDVEQILVRIDDKLARIRNGTQDSEDTELDLLGYLTILRIARRS